MMTSFYKINVGPNRVPSGIRRWRHAVVKETQGHPRPWAGPGNGGMDPPALKFCRVRLLADNLTYAKDSKIFSINTDLDRLLSLR